MFHIRNYGFLCLATLDYEILSEGFSVDTSKFYVNNIDYSQHQRGINLVVVDAKTGILLFLHFRYPVVMIMIWV